MSGSIICEYHSIEAGPEIFRSPQKTTHSRLFPLELAHTTVRPAPRGEDARGHMETVSVSFTCKNISSEKIRQRMEIASNIQAIKFGLNVRHTGLQPSIFVRSFSQITTR